MFTSVLHTTLLSLKAASERLRSRFNLSFWCTVYNIFLVIFLAIGCLLSGIAYACVNGFARLRERIFDLRTRLVERRQSAMNLVQIRDYFSKGK